MYQKDIKYKQSPFGADFAMEINGNREISVEGLRGVAEYEESYIKLNAGKGSVVLFGNSFRITHFSVNGLTVIGNIEKIEFCM